MYSVPFDSTCKTCDTTVCVRIAVILEVDGIVRWEVVIYEIYICICGIDFVVEIVVISFVYVLNVGASMRYICLF